MDLAQRISELEQETGQKYTDRDKAYALELVRTGNQSAAARAAGASEQRAAQTGREMAHDPKIQQLVDEINQYQNVQLTEEFVTNALLKEAVKADAPRDRINALQLLGKTRKLKMFTENIEQTNVDKSDEEFIAQVERMFGKEAADKAREDMGLE